MTKTFAHDDELISHVTVFDLAAGIKETFHVTANHPFYAEGSGWVPASALQFGSTLTNSVFGNLLVTKVKHAVGRERVYNIEVEDFHSYYVGQIAVWVHNKGNSPVAGMSSLKNLQTEVKILDRPNWKNTSSTDSRANTGAVSEALGRDAIELGPAPLAVSLRLWVDR